MCHNGILLCRTVSHDDEMMMMMKWWWYCSMAAASDGVQGWCS